MIEFPDPFPHDPRLEEFKLRLALLAVFGSLLAILIAATVTW